MKPKQPQPERLQKVLARAGVASRRASEAIIQQGRVSVNGQVVTEMGTKVDPQHDVITVDGRPLPRPIEKMVYIMLNKPRYVLSTVYDDRGRQTVLDLVDVPARIYPVGRLDLRSEGLILLTNDGDLTKKLTHPSHHIEKEYHVLVLGNPSTQTLQRWQRGGLEVDEKAVASAVVQRMKMQGDNTWLRVILTEGRKRQIREVAQTLGHPVKRLIRDRFGPLRLGQLMKGQWRHLSPREVDRLKTAVSSSGHRR
ncbi:MAG: rRNA pseudouridine synthase [Anaerolineae bacterium]|nr:rRNA pseudouridine synthase [Anaerolineae bacterium]